MPSRSSEHAGLGKAIQIMRIRRGLTQESLALDSGIDRSYLGGVERGERNPTYVTLLRLARVFDLKPSELLDAAEREAARLEQRGQATSMFEGVGRDGQVPSGPDA